MPVCSRWESSTRSAGLPPREDRVKPWETIDHKAPAQNMAIYTAMVDHMDQAVTIVDALEKNKCLENTFIIYFHDNGAAPAPRWERMEYGQQHTGQSQESGQDDRGGRQIRRPDGRSHDLRERGHNWANAQNTPCAVTSPASTTGSLHAPHRSLAGRTQDPTRQHLQATRSRG